MKRSRFFPLHVRICALALAVGLAFTLPARAQAPMPSAFGAPQPAPAAQPQPSANNNVSASSAGDYRSSTSEGMVDRLFNVNSDSVDFENGSFQWKGRTFNLGNSRLMRARLEKYLATPAPSGEGRRYEQILRQIEDLLSPARITPQNYVSNVQTAWNLLDEAAKFEGDADNCRTISTLVYKTAQMRRELRQLKIDRSFRHQEKDAALREYTSYEQWREDNEDAAAGTGTTSSTRGGKTTTKSKGPPPKVGTAESKRRQERLVEARKELATVESQSAGIGLKARLEFQSQIVTFLLQRRFHHAIIASGFYRQIFQSKEHDLRVGNKQVKEMFPVSDIVPTIDSIEGLAREAIRDVDTGMKAITALYDNGERFGAFERMQETFFLGEYEPSVLYFSPEKKHVLREIWSTSRDLQRMGDDRDLAGCEAAVKKIRANAEDFPATQVLSKVNNAKQASDLEIFAAETAFFQKDTQSVKNHLTAAAKIWPTNPALNDFARRVRERTNQIAQMTPEFDRLLSENAHRSIFNRKQEFALALMGDEVRARKLKEIVERLGKIDAILFQARTFHKQNNTCPAWDLAQEAAKLEAGDPEISKAITELAPAAAAYARLLDQARASEQEGHLAVALTAMLAAQELNQGSELCRTTIQRLTQSLLNTL
ncbi:MAG: hypothetical protein LBG65_01470 [Puniceicoccales bacterium]|jgi:hypothetical protein|nr:hypothetical protein [Puniceicoccales bacterium]